MPISDCPTCGIIELDPVGSAEHSSPDDSTLDSLLTSFAHHDSLAPTEDHHRRPAIPASRYPQAAPGIDCELTLSSEAAIRADLVQLALQLHERYQQSLCGTQRHA